MSKTITVDGVDYVPASPAPTGNRAICVLDRGWIFVGHLNRLDDGTCELTECSNVRKWQTGGFGLLARDREASGATLDECAPIRFASGAMLFCVPVGETW